ncbi:P-II family nitrogen regulator [Salsuginibacillus kocurii]|uniref:P-II family nitrogen regulator n=1 Tax=Salsuginibacillus kocurii TaxID=427078 RepID=UPI000380E764|nr:P-II family nitrogen regulator [Salsuginibacillus kocurii]
MQYDNLKMVVTIVKEDKAKEVLAAFENIGVQGWSVTRGRGQGEHAEGKFFGQMVVPEKEIIFTVTSESSAAEVMEAANQAGDLEQPGQGISCIINIEDALGLIQSPE